MDPLPSTARGSLPSLSHDATGGNARAFANPSDAASEKWERFAQDDPYSYILTSLGGADRNEFWRSGERIVHQELLPLVQFYDVRPLRALEVGCGIGRLAIPLSRHFNEVLGVDIAQSMVRRATSFAEHNGIANASYTWISGPEDLLSHAAAYGGCDLIYSLLVFQHVPEFSLIEGYLRAIRALLEERGLAYLQFDTRPTSVAYHLKTRLPDFLLPRFWRRGIRRIRRSPDEIQQAIQGAGLEIVVELTPRTAYHRYILRLPQSRPGAK